MGTPGPVSLVFSSCLIQADGWFIDCQCCSGLFTLLVYDLDRAYRKCLEPLPYFPICCLALWLAKIGFLEGFSRTPSASLIIVAMRNLEPRSIFT